MSGEEPVVDEDELNDWITDNVETGGFSASVSIDKWDRKGVHPKEITITLSCKTGDGIGQPYSDTPPDEGVIEDLERHGWNAEAIRQLFDSIIILMQHYGIYRGPPPKPKWRKLKLIEQPPSFSQARGRERGV
ncbi:MAG: hypothetical protein QXO20_06300 [Candidatus Bathyarchaeia archaeon]